MNKLSKHFYRLDFLVWLWLASVISPSIWAQSSTNALAVGQGISSPTLTTPINYGNGFTQQNPVGVIYQKSFRITGEIDRGDNGNDGYGIEFGAGNGKMGIGIGYDKRQCSGCGDDTAVAAGFTVSDIGIGLRFEEELSTVGFLFGPNNSSRWGLVVQVNDPAGAGNNISALGFGYSYVSSGFTFSLDASKREYEDKTTVNKNVVMLTPGLALRANKFALSVSYNMFLNEDDGNALEDKVWWGLGIGGEKDWHVALYSDYVNELALAVSFFF